MFLLNMDWPEIDLLPIYLWAHLVASDKAD